MLLNSSEVISWLKEKLMISRNTPLPVQTWRIIHCAQQSSRLFYPKKNISNHLENHEVFQFFSFLFSFFFFSLAKKICHKSSKIFKYLNHRFQCKWTRKKLQLLFIVCKNGFLEIVKLMMSDQTTRIHISMGWEPSPLSPFFPACSNGHLEIVKLIQE